MLVSHRFPFYRLLLYVLILVSGACALVYEVVWSRMLVLVLGNTTVATGAILAAYMAGLALGSAFWGRYAVSRRGKALIIFALLELGTAMSGSMLTFLIPYMASMALWGAVYDHGPLVQMIIRFGLCVAVMLIPTFFMGGTLPVLGHFLVRRGPSVGADIANLYGINTVGAAFGALVTGFLLLRYFGHTHSLFLAIGLNAVIGLIALAIHWRTKKLPECRTAMLETVPEGAYGAHSSDHFDPVRPGVHRLQLVIVLGALFVAGFCALAHEVFWTRLLIPVVDNSVYSFTIVLFGFLLGIALGAVVTAGFARFIKYPLQFFGMALLATAITAYGFPFWIHLTRVGTEMPYWQGLVLKLPLALMVPTFCMGVTVSLGTWVLIASRKGVSRMLGWGYACNSLGAVIGAASAALFLLPTVGMRNGILLLAGLNLLTTLIVWGIGMSRIKLVLACFMVGGIALGSLKAMPSGFFADRFNELEPDSRLIFYREGRDATAGIFQRPDGHRAFYINGIAEVDTSHLSVRTFKLLGALPGLLHSDPRHALMVTFGAGISAGTTALFVEHLDCVDLVDQPQAIAARFDRANNQVLKFPHVVLHSDDARHFLRKSDRHYDIIISDATHPRSYDSWILFTTEFYHLVQKRLGTDGIFCQWLPFHGLAPNQYLGIVRTFASVFPHATLWRIDTGYSILLATPRVLSIDFEALVQRLSQPTVKRDLAGVGLDNPFRLLAHFTLGEEGIEKLTSDGEAVFTDNQPTHLFFAPGASLDVQYRQWPLANLNRVVQHEQSVVAFLTNLPPQPRLRQKIIDMVLFYEARQPR